MGCLNVNIRLNGFHQEVKVYLVSLLCSFNVVYSSKSLRQGQHPKQLHAHFSCKSRNKEILFRRINYQGEQWFALPEWSIIICMLTEFRRIWNHRFVLFRWGLGWIYWIPALVSLFPDPGGWEASPGSGSAMRLQLMTHEVRISKLPFPSTPIIHVEGGRVLTVLAWGPLQILANPTFLMQMSVIRKVIILILSCLWLCTLLPYLYFIKLVSIRPRLSHQILTLLAALWGLRITLPMALAKGAKKSPWKGLNNSKWICE